MKQQLKNKQENIQETVKEKEKYIIINKNVSFKISFNQVINDI